jgi:isopenicillin-N N-acyltransferase like protein
VAGGPRDRGRQYGAAAAARVRRTVRCYRDLYRTWSGWDWPRARREAARYAGAIEDAAPGQIEEMRGIAEGAGLELGDVLAINARTELLAGARVDGCTAVAVLPEASADGRTLLAQNWDWLMPSANTVVVLDVERSDGPGYTTVVEAGLLAKVSMNSAGLGVCTNFLLTEDDPDASGFPYHTALRALLDAETLSGALAVLRALAPASSANYLLAHVKGVAMDVEVSPAGGLQLIAPEQGILTHANHFRAGSVRDLAAEVAPCSKPRERRLDTLLRARVGRIDRHDVQAALSDHEGYPKSVCYHEDPREDPADRSVTAASIVMDLDARTMALAPGNPCVSPYRVLHCASALAGV